MVLPSNAETMELSLVLNGSELLFNLTDDFHIDLPYINSEFQSFETFSGSFSFSILIDRKLKKKHYVRQTDVTE